MLLRFESVPGQTAGEVPVAGEEQWLLAWLGFSLSAAEEAVITGPAPDGAIVSQLARAGMAVSAQPGRSVLRRHAASHAAVEADFTALPLAALPLAVACAASGLQADIRGLEALMHYGGADLVSPFQRAFYRMGILSDFCDRSKLKIFNDRPLRKKGATPDFGENEVAALFFIPLAHVSGTVDLEMGKAPDAAAEAILRATGIVRSKAG